MLCFKKKDNSTPLKLPLTQHITSYRQNGLEFEIMSRQILYFFKVKCIYLWKFLNTVNVVLR